MREAVAAHLADCPACRAELDRELALRAALAHLPAAACPDAVSRRVLDAIAAEQSGIRRRRQRLVAGVTLAAATVARGPGPAPGNTPDAAGADRAGGRAAGARGSTGAARPCRLRRRRGCVRLHPRTGGGSAARPDPDRRPGRARHRPDRSRSDFRCVQRTAARRGDGLAAFVERSHPRRMTMKARLLTLSLSLSLCAVLALPALAQDITKLPGYVDLDWIRIPDGAAEIQDIVLDPRAGRPGRRRRRCRGRGPQPGAGHGQVGAREVLLAGRRPGTNPRLPPMSRSCRSA
jgi:hypothetical protein